MTPEPKVARVARIRLRVFVDAWPAARQAGQRIAEHWQRRAAETPGLYNGTVFVLQRYEIDDACFTGAFLKTDFATFLGWRENVFTDPLIRDCFGVAIVRSADGGILLGRQRHGLLNSGLTYPPAGFIDAADVGADGGVAMDASITREVREETGLDVAAACRRVPGYAVALSGKLVALAIEWRTALSGPELLRDVRAHIAADPAPELEEAVLVRHKEDMADLKMPDYARVLLDAVLLS